jgi:pyruvate dehydrogenase E2 component (dihydrolipoamide acetyltransferase)
MFAEVNGTGPPVLFLHGLGGSSYSWRETWPDLAGRYTTYAVDLPGFGPHGLPGQESAPLPENAWNVVGLADAVRGFILSRGLTAPIVIGHSMGGAVALRLAEAANNAGSGFGIARMVLLAPAAFPPNGSAFAGVFTATDAASRARAILQIAYANPGAISQKQVDAYATGLSVGHLPVFSALALDLPRIGSPPPRFAGIAAETLVIWGDEDRILPPDEAPPASGPAKALCAALPHASLVEILRCGHIPQEEKMAETNAAIAAFLH